MKQNLLVSLMLLISVSVWGQENLIAVNGGYAFANVENTGENLSGWRINLSYEFNAYEGKMANGAAVGYIVTEATIDSGGQQGTNYKLTTWPIYYMPKYLFGGDSFKGFIKGALGIHISDYTETRPLLIKEDNGVGFYGGLGAGAMYTINKIFLNLEYEWAFASNAQYRNGFMNSAMLGIGIKF